MTALTNQQIDEIADEMEREVEEAIAQLDLSEKETRKALRTCKWRKEKLADGGWQLQIKYKNRWYTIAREDLDREICSVSLETSITEWREHDLILGARINKAEQLFVIVDSFTDG